MKMMEDPGLDWRTLMLDGRFERLASGNFIDFFWELRTEVIEICHVRYTSRQE